MFLGCNWVVSTKVMQQKTKIKNERLIKDKYIPPHVLTK